MEKILKKNLKEIEQVVVDWFHLAQDRDWWWDLVNTVMYLRVPYKERNLLTSSATISFSRTVIRGIG
jgi:hypothetical protein